MGHDLAVLGDLVADLVVPVERLPLELAEPREGDPITHDDLLDFHELIERDDTWIARLAGLVDG